MVDNIRFGTKGLIIFPATIPVGAVAGAVPQDPAGINGDEQAAGVPIGTIGSATLVGTTGNSHPAEVLNGNTVLRVSVWNGLCIPLDPA